MIHIIIGPVGAGKSTFALELAAQQRAVRLTLDQWMATLFGDDVRPSIGRIAWYQERTRRCLDQIFELTRQLDAVGTNLILEVGLVQRDSRWGFFDRLDAAHLAFVVYVVDADREVRRERVRRRNHERGETFSMEVPDDVFEIASDMWQPPNEAEHARWTFVEPNSY